jgi:uncharacterized OB-fold protein
LWLMKCHNCERVVAPTRTRCQACRTRLPAWYFVMGLVTVVGLFAAFKVVEAIL